MKVLQVNTIYKNKSTGRTCFELSEALEKMGHQCLTAYGHQRVEEKNSYCINSDIEYKIHNLLSRITGLEGYFSYFATKRLIKKIKAFDPDIIHLRNLHGHYLNLPLFFRYLNKAQKPVVMHLHDCWILTGKCCHPTYHSCNGWLTECKNCPAKSEYPVSWCFDFSKMMFRHKKKWFSDLDKCVVIGVSEWTANEGRKSYLGKFPVERVYNWINTDIFRPYNDVKKSDFGLDDTKFTIICSGASWHRDDSKGRDLSELAEKLEDDMQILLVGEADENINHEKIIKAGFTNDTQKLAKMYSVSDAYVHLSTADTFGKVIAEALSCGTPAVVYNTTACPELVVDGCGEIVELHDIDGVISGLSKIKDNGKDFYSVNCRKRVEENFNYENNITQTLDLYNNLLR